MVTYFGHNVSMSINSPARFWIFKACQWSYNHLRTNRAFIIIQYQVKIQVTSKKLVHNLTWKPWTANTTKLLKSVIQYFHVIDLKLTESQTVTNQINKENEKTQITNVCFVLYLAHTCMHLCESKNGCIHVFFTKQTTVKSIKVLVRFQDAEETCKICKTGFNEERNKITLGERGSSGINYASVQLREDLSQNGRSCPCLPSMCRHQQEGHCC